ncbi:hypothetical protein [Paracoccus homiensis]
MLIRVVVPGSVVVGMASR